MYYAELRKMDITNGSGIRVSLFVSGCNFHCKTVLIKKHNNLIMAKNIHMIHLIVFVSLLINHILKAVLFLVEM